MEFSSRYLINVFCLSFLLGFYAITAKADFQVDVAEAPTSNLNLTVSAIQSAKRSVHMNIYELSSPEIADAIIAKIQEGVQVEVLEEGQPVGGMSAAAKGIEQEIVQAMQQQKSAGNHLYIMTSKATQTKRRFRFDHGKYAVIDDTNLLIGSENYSPTGNPVAGTKGNRGWEVFIHEANIAKNFDAMFASDTDSSHGDIMDASRSSTATLEFGWSTDDFYSKKNPGAPTQPNPPKQSPGKPGGSSLTASNVVKVTSPDSSLSGLVNLLNSARKTIDIQQMTFDSAWSSGNNPLIAAIQQAAKRGVQVRVLLNDESVFNHSSKPSNPKNQPTVDLLNKIRGVSARIADVKAMGVDYIHNKGALVDGNLTLISSINWDENSITKNREAAVVLTSTDIFSHYEALFDHDWSVSPERVISSLSDQFSSVEEEERIFSDSPQTDQSLRCPNALDIFIKIGDLTLDKSDRDSYGSIENSKIAGAFVKSASGSGCLLLGAGTATDTSKKQFILIRSAGGGKKNIVYESYTPKGNKLFSVRLKIGMDEKISGHFDAGVYEGSAARSYLGVATLDAKEND